MILSNTLLLERSLWTIYTIIMEWRNDNASVVVTDVDLDVVGD